jgi:hypothetical protein
MSDAHRARSRMVARQLCRRGIVDERVLAAMERVLGGIRPRGARRARVRRRGASDRGGSDDLAAVHRRGDVRALTLAGTETVLTSARARGTPPRCWTSCGGGRVDRGRAGAAGGRAPPSRRRVTGPSTRPRRRRAGAPDRAPFQATAIAAANRCDPDGARRAAAMGGRLPRRPAIGAGNSSCVRRPRTASLRPGRCPAGSCRCRA